METLFGRKLVDFFIAPVLRCARDSTCPANLSLKDYLLGVNNNSGHNAVGIIPYYTSILAGFAAMIATYYIIFAGYQMFTAFGDESKFTAGKKTMQFAIIGFVISMSAYFLIHFFTGLLGYTGT